MSLSQRRKTPCSEKFSSTGDTLKEKRKKKSSTIVERMTKLEENLDPVAQRMRKGKGL